MRFVNTLMIVLFLSPTSALAQSLWNPAKPMPALTSDTTAFRRTRRDRRGGAARRGEPRGSAAPALARGDDRPGAPAREPGRVHSRGARAEGAAGSSALPRPPRPRQDVPRPRGGPRDGRPGAGHERPGGRAARRPGGAALEPRAGRRAVHRRDPPSLARKSRRSSTRRWRTSSSTSSSARGPAPRRFASTCRASP